jgi:hypothetical protein
MGRRGQSFRVDGVEAWWFLDESWSPSPKEEFGNVSDRENAHEHINSVVLAPCLKAFYARECFVDTELVSGGADSLSINIAECYDGALG